MCQAAWAARRQQAQEDRIQRLEQQVRGYELQLSRATRKIGILTAQLAPEMQDDLASDPLHSPCDRIFLDIVQNREREVHGRRYSLETRSGSLYTLCFPWLDHLKR